MFFSFPERLSFFNGRKYLAYKDTTEENNDKIQRRGEFRKINLGIRIMNYLYMMETDPVKWVKTQRPKFKRSRINTARDPNSCQTRGETRGC